MKQTSPSHRRLSPALLATLFVAYPAAILAVIVFAEHIPTAVGVGLILVLMAAAVALAIRSYRRGRTAAASGPDSAPDPAPEVTPVRADAEPGPGADRP